MQFLGLHIMGCIIPVAINVGFKSGYFTRLERFN
jgi:hypothetical protein